MSGIRRGRSNPKRFNQMRLPGMRAPVLTHGGTLSEGKRKLARPLDRKRPVHIVLRSTKAKGPLSMRRQDRAQAICGIVTKAAKRFGVRVHSFANVGNHLHLCASFHSKHGFQDFLRAITGLIARLVTGARKGKPFGRFWDHLGFSRVVSRGRDFAALARYIEANAIEGLFGRWERAGFEDRRMRFNNSV